MKYDALVGANRLMQMYVDGVHEVIDFAYDNSSAFGPTADSDWWVAYNSHSYSPYLRDSSIEITDIRFYGEVLSETDVVSLYEQKGSIDKTGNLFVNELDINGIGNHQANHFAYENITVGELSGSPSFYDNNGLNRMYFIDDADETTSYELLQNPFGEEDYVINFYIDTTSYVQYSHPTTYYYFTDIDQSMTYRYTQ